MECRDGPANQKLVSSDRYLNPLFLEGTPNKNGSQHWVLTG